MNKSIKYVISIMMAMLFAVSAIGCDKAKPTESSVYYASPEEAINSENRVFYYYDAVVATQGGNEHTVFELYNYTDKEMVLVKYRKYPGKDQTMDYCLVPASTLDDCMKLTKKYKMGKGKWEKGGDCVVGKEFAIVFFKDGEYVRVTSECMPDNGINAFDAVCEVLGGAWKAAQ
ncbi:MAG: hypothetical protein IKE92_07750 [Clostridiales bacterium]|nr:hypothetical protein [Clostridiales bacterium]